MDSLDQLLQNTFGNKLLLPSSQVRKFLTRRIFDEAREKGELIGANRNAKIQRYYRRDSVYRVASNMWYPQGVDSPQTIALESRIKTKVQKLFEKHRGL